MQWHVIYVLIGLLLIAASPAILFLYLVFYSAKLSLLHAASAIRRSLAQMHHPS